MTVTGKNKSAGGGRHNESRRPLHRERRIYRKMQSESWKRIGRRYYGV